MIYPILFPIICSITYVIIVRDSSMSTLVGRECGSTDVRCVGQGENANSKFSNIILAIVLTCPASMHYVHVNIGVTCSVCTALLC